jgi:hypothetical protein
MDRSSIRGEILQRQSISHQEKTTDQLQSVHVNRAGQANRLTLKAPSLTGNHFQNILIKQGGLFYLNYENTTPYQRAFKVCSSHCQRARVNLLKPSGNFTYHQV